jgi:hypothetical protein
MPYEKIIIHDVIENRFEDLISMLISGSKSQGGQAAPMINWCNGVIFQIATFNSNSEEIISQQLKGVIHYAAVNFATKKDFEPVVQTPDGLIRLIDQSANAHLVKMAEVLKKNAKYQS